MIMRENTPNGRETEYSNNQNNNLQGSMASADFTQNYKYRNST